MVTDRRKNSDIMKTTFLESCFLQFLAMGCTEDELEPMGHNSTPPGQVTGIEVENLRVRRNFPIRCPDDPDLLYVKAVYRLNSGVMREIKASYYTNTMTLDGFGDTNIHEVQVYAVNRSEVASEPVSVKVQPQENPIWSVRRSLVIADDFSGVNIKAENPSRESVAIEIMCKDSLGTWQTLESVESSLPKIEAACRRPRYAGIRISLYGSRPFPELYRYALCHGASAFRTDARQVAVQGLQLTGGRIARTTGLAGDGSHVEQYLRLYES